MDKILRQREANSRANANWMKKKWTNKWKNERANEWPNEQIDDFRLHLFIYRLKWVRRIWLWRDEWYDTVLWTQDSKFKPWWSQYYPRSRRLPTILNLYEWARKKLFFLRNLNVRARDETRDLRFFKQAALATAPGHTRNYLTSRHVIKTTNIYLNRFIYNYGLSPLNKPKPQTEDVY